MSAQDPDVPEPSVSLADVLAELRILAGHRGHAQVTWTGQGFTYVLAGVRDPEDTSAPMLDDDQSGDGLLGVDAADIRSLLAAHLEVHP